MHDVDGILDTFAERSGLSFKNRALLRTALTHGSYLNQRTRTSTRRTTNGWIFGDAVSISCSRIISMSIFQTSRRSSCTT